MKLCCMSSNVSSAPKAHNQPLRTHFKDLVIYVFFSFSFLYQDAQIIHLVLLLFFMWKFSFLNQCRPYQFYHPCDALMLPLPVNAMIIGVGVHLFKHRKGNIEKEAQGVPGHRHIESWWGEKCLHLNKITQLFIIKDILSDTMTVKIVYNLINVVLVSKLRSCSKWKSLYSDFMECSDTAFQNYIKISRFPL